MSSDFENGGNTDLKLTAVQNESDYLEETDDSETENQNHELDETEEAACNNRQIKLQERLTLMQNLLHNLRLQLHQEKELLRKEVEEISHCSTCCHFDNCFDVRNEEVDEGAYSVGDTQDMLPSNVEDFNVLGYEQQLARYQEFLSRDHFDRRMTFQRQLAASNFQRRLLEVENMCNLELLRVKQSANFLHPLQVMASEWNRDLQSGDGDRKNVEKGKLEESNKAKEQVVNTELIGTKLYNEMNNMFSKSIQPLSPYLQKCAPTVGWQSSNGNSSESNNSNSGTYLSDASQNLSN